MAGADRMAIEEVVRKVLVDEHADVLRESVRWLVAQLMEVEVSELIGAERGERTEDRATHRNGYRPRRWDTRAGEIELQIPKIRQGSLFPELPAAQKALRAGAAQRGPAGLCVRRVDAARSPRLSTSGRRAGSTRRTHRPAGPRRAAPARSAFWAAGSSGNTEPWRILGICNSISPPWCPTAGADNRCDGWPGPRCARRARRRSARRPRPPSTAGPATRRTRATHRRARRPAPS